MKTSGHYIYHEEQSFRESPVIFLILGIGLIMIGVQVTGMYQQLYLHKPWGDHPESDQVLLWTSVGIILFMLLMIVLFMSLTLITEVRNEGFYYRFPVLIPRLKSIRKEEIERYEVGEYHPVRDFGGWGIRRRGFRRKAYNVRGRQGVKFYLKDGKVVLFGTQRPEELRSALGKMMNPSML